MADNPRIEELRRRVEKDPASIAFAQLAEEFRRVGSYDEAVRICRTGLAKHPSYLSARVTLGRSLIELGQYDEARTELDYVLRSAPENLAAIRGLAEIHQRRGELAEALKQYQAALGIAKHDPDLEESVNELTRQISGAAPEAAAPSAVPLAQVPAPAPGPPASPPLYTFVTPPPAPRPPAPAAEPRAPVPVVERREPAPPVETRGTASALEEAADEFTKALQALDALTIELPDTPPLPPPSLPPPAPKPVKERQAGPPAPPAPAKTEAAPQPTDAAALRDLESWLNAVSRDRNSKRRT